MTRSANLFVLVLVLTLTGCKGNRIAGESVWGNEDSSSRYGFRRFPARIRTIVVARAPYRADHCSPFRVSLLRCKFLLVRQRPLRIIRVVPVSSVLARRPWPPGMFPLRFNRSSENLACSPFPISMTR